MPISNDQGARSENYRVANEPTPRKYAGEAVAEIFKYYRQQNVSNIQISKKRVSARTLYMQHAKAFDGLAKIFSKYNIDVETYIKFFVTILGKTENNIDSDLLSGITLTKFADRLSIIEKRKNVYGWFMKSANNVADYCLSNDIISTFDGIRSLISNKKLAAWYMSGMMSKYFVAAIPGFNKVIPRLDYFSKCELNDVLNKFDIYRTEVNEAFLYFKRRKVNPYAVTDILILNKRREFVKKREAECLFDASLDENPKCVK